MSVNLLKSSNLMAKFIVKYITSMDLNYEVPRGYYSKIKKLAKNYKLSYTAYRENPGANKYSESSRIPNKELFEIGYLMADFLLKLNPISSCNDHHHFYHANYERFTDRARNHAFTLAPYFLEAIKEGNPQDIPREVPSQRFRHVSYGITPGDIMFTLSDEYKRSKIQAPFKSGLFSYFLAYEILDYVHCLSKYENDYRKGILNNENSAFFRLFHSKEIARGNIDANSRLLKSIKKDVMGLTENTIDDQLMVGAKILYQIRMAIKNIENNVDSFNNKEKPFFNHSTGRSHEYLSSINKSFGNFISKYCRNFQLGFDIKKEVQNLSVEFENCVISLDNHLTNS